MSSPPAGLSAFLETGGFALELAQIVEFRPAHFARADHIDMVDNGRVQRENSLDPLTEADFADRNGLAHARVLACQHGAFEDLNALFFAFLDLDVNLYRIAGTEFGHIGAAL